MLSQVHLDEVQVLLQKFRLLARLVNDVNFVAQDDYRNAEVHFKDSFAQWHVKSDVVVGAQVGIQVVPARPRRRLRLKLFLHGALVDQISIVVELGLLVGLRVSLNLLLHLFVRAGFHLGYQIENCLTQG